MVRPDVVTLAALPLINALYIPHSFSDLTEIKRTDARRPVKQVVSTQELDRDNQDPMLPDFADDRASRKHLGNASGGKEPKEVHVRPETGNGPESKDIHIGFQKDSSTVFCDENAQPIPDRYIIMFKDHVKPIQIAKHMSWLADTSRHHAQTLMANSVEHPLLTTDLKHIIEQVYNVTMKGYAGALLPSVAEKLTELPEVAFVERDQVVRTLSGSSGSNWNREDHSVTENGAPWGLARISHRKALALGSFNKYIYDEEGGEGVTTYVIDSGVYLDHNDFGGRAEWGKTFLVDDVDEDTIGHGSHCAGTIAGAKYGVAKKARIVAVKVIGSDGSGSMSSVFAGLEWTVRSHQEEHKKNKQFKGSTANMSLGGGKSLIFDLVVNAATLAGVHFAVAAGNGNQSACNVSPAGASEPVTVGATTIGDERASFSNYGSCVDIFAPGVNVLSVGISTPGSTEIMSGTSMATPHVCGLLSYFLSLQPSTDSEYATRGTITPKELKEDIVAFGTPDKIADLDGNSPNVLAYNGGGKDISFFWNRGPGMSEDEENEEFLLDEVKHLAIEGYDVVEEKLDDVIRGLF